MVYGWLVRKAVGSSPSSNTTVTLQAPRGVVTGCSAAARLALTVLPELFVLLKMCWLAWPLPAL